MSVNAYEEGETDVFAGSDSILLNMLPPSRT